MILGTTPARGRVNPGFRAKRLIFVKLFGQTLTTTNNKLPIDLYLPHNTNPTLNQIYTAKMVVMYQVLGRQVGSHYVWNTLPDSAKDP
jgi:hypothetical protein